MGFYSDFIEKCEQLGDPELVARLMKVRHQLVGLLPPGVSVAFPYSHFKDVPEKLREEAAREALYFVQTGVLMRRSRIVRLLGPQAKVFLDTPSVEGQDYVRWLRLPYPELYIQVDPPVAFTDYAGEYEGPPRSKVAAAMDPPGGGVTPGLLHALTHGELHPTTGPHPGPGPLVTGHSPGVLMEGQGVLADDAEAIARAWRSKYAGDPIARGALLIECPGSEIQRLGFKAREAFLWHVSDEQPAEDIDMTACERVLQVVFLLPLPDYYLNTHIATLCVMKNNQLLYSKQGLWQTRKRMIDWAIHVVNFLSSPSVKLVPTNPPVALQKARARRGKPPLPGWYEITYRKVIKEYTKDPFSPKRWEHSFRYDVRGHFAHYTKGVMAGRVVWIPQHQRGLKHQLYKPKTYRVGQEPTGPESAAPWRG